jgi:hypothetical protein
MTLKALNGHGFAGLHIAGSDQHRIITGTFLHGGDLNPGGDLGNFNEVAGFFVLGVVKQTVRGLVKADDHQARRENAEGDFVEAQIHRLKPC